MLASGQAPAPSCPVAGGPYITDSRQTAVWRPLNVTPFGTNATSTPAAYSAVMHKLLVRRQVRARAGATTASSAAATNSSAAVLRAKAMVACPPEGAARIRSECRELAGLHVGGRQHTFGNGHKAGAAVAAGAAFESAHRILLQPPAGSRQRQKRHGSVLPSKRRLAEHPAAANVQKFSSPARSGALPRLEGAGCSQPIHSCSQAAGRHSASGDESCAPV